MTHFIFFYAVVIKYLLGFFLKFLVAKCHFILIFDVMLTIHKDLSSTESQEGGQIC